MPVNVREGPEGEPKSEGRVIMSVIRKLYRVHNFIMGRPHPVGSSEIQALNDAIRALEALGHQVTQGHHRNPPKGKFGAGEAMKMMSDDVHELRYVHRDDKKPYKHDFGGDVEMWAVRRGDSRDILLTHKEGKPLWEDF